MTLPASGVLGLQDINVELGKSGNTAIGLNDADVRTLAAKPSGVVAISDFHGKSAAPQAPIGSSIYSLVYNSAVRDQNGTDAVQDSLGNLYFCGADNALYSGLYSGIIIKLDPNGNALWKKKLSQSGYYFELTQIATDSSNNVFVAGIRRHLTSGLVAFFVIKLDGNGNILASAQFGGGAYNILYSMTLDVNGNVYIAGTTNEFGFVGGTYDAYMAKFNNSCVYQWGRRVGTSGQEAFYDVDVDSAGNVYLVGMYYNGVSYYATLNKFDVNGNMLWRKRFYYQQYSLFLGIRVDTSDNLIVYGTSYYSTIQGAVLAKFNSNGDVIWTKFASNIIGPYGFGDVDVDASGNIYIGGVYSTSQYLYANSFLGKVNSAGSYVWGRVIGYYGEFVDNVVRHLHVRNGYVTTGMYSNDDDFGEARGTIVKIKADGSDPASQTPISGVMMFENAAFSFADITMVAEAHTATEGSVVPSISAVEFTISDYTTLLLDRYI